MAAYTPVWIANWWYSEGRAEAVEAVTEGWQRSCGLEDPSFGRLCCSRLLIGSGCRPHRANGADGAELDHLAKKSFVLTRYEFNDF